MVVTCAFYGFANRTTRVTLQVDRDQLEVGQLLAFEGEQYMILSVFEAAGHYHANVGLEYLYRQRPPARLKTVVPGAVALADMDTPASRQESALYARLQAAEARLQDLLRERDEVLQLLDHAIQQLDHLQQSVRS